MLWNPRVGIEGAQESGVDRLRHWVEPLYTRAALPARDRRALLRAVRRCACWRSSSCSTRRRRPGCSPGRPATACRGTSCSRSSPRRRSTGSGRRSRPGAKSALRRPQRLSVRGHRLVDERRHPLRVLLGRRRPLRCRCGRAVTEASGEIAVGEHALERRRQRLGISGRDEEAVDPVLDDVRDAACGGADHGPTADE